MKSATDFCSSYIANSVFNVFLCYTAIMLNSVTIHAIRKTSSLPKPLKTLLLSLAVSDLGVGFLEQPLYISVLVMELKSRNENDPESFNTVGSAVGFVLPSTVHLFSLCSLFGVIALSPDRFLAIHLHLRYQELVTHKRVVAVVISIWVFNAFLSLLQVWRPNMSAIVISISLIVCVISATFFYLAVRRHEHQIQAVQVQPVTHNGETMANVARLRKSAVCSFYVYLVFLVCTMSNTCIYIDGVVCHYASIKTSLTVSVFPLYSLTLVFLNSFLNPLIYCWKMRRIRHSIMNILRNVFSNQN